MGTHLAKHRNLATQDKNLCEYKPYVIRFKFVLVRAAD